MSSAAASLDSAVKSMTDSYQFWVAHKNLRVTFQSHIRFARKVKKCGDAFSKSSSIFNACKNKMSTYVSYTKSVNYEDKMNLLRYL